MILNPLYGLLGGWTDLLVRSQIPPLSVWLSAVVWAIVVFIGGSLFFMSREREFAVRI
jgi:teichoic acid transport system permease protein